MYLKRMFYQVAMAIGNVVVLTNPVDFLDDPNKNNGAFSGIQSLGEGYFASGYQAIEVLGLCLLAIAALAAAILFGFFKDTQKVKENNTWLLRIIGAVAIVACIMTVFGFAFDAGSAANNALTVTPTPTP